MIRYQILPVTLYRMQSTLKAILREQTEQRKKKSRSFDFILGANKLYNPIVGNTFEKPNGLSLRPKGPNLYEIGTAFMGKYVFQMPQGLQLPDGLVLVHERTDHYSLQTTVPIEPKKFCELATLLFKQQKTIPFETFMENLSKEVIKRK